MLSHPRKSNALASLQKLTGTLQPMFDRPLQATDIGYIHVIYLEVRCRLASVAFHVRDARNACVRCNCGRAGRRQLGRRLRQRRWRRPSLGGQLFKTLQPTAYLR